MSMWLGLAKISPELLAQVRAEPKLVERLFFNSTEGIPAGVDEEADVFGTDYRTLALVATAGDEESFEDDGSWLSKGAHGLGDVLDYEFCYGLGFALEPSQVAEIAAGLTADGDVTDDPTDDEDLGAFYVAAAREGKAVVGGVS